ncbi:MAG TPA: MFS transporter [Atribacterota bacterium]|nr:MFS transporter [Atribacterota bacterium]
MNSINNDINQKKILDRNKFIIFLVSFSVPMGAHLVSPALPVIMLDLGIREEAISLFNVFFTLAGIIVLPFIGVMSDRFSNKKILVVSLFSYGISGFLCSFINNFSLLLMLRFIQGMSVAYITVINLIMISDLFEGKLLIKVLGINTSFLQLGGVVWPAIGGLVSESDWHTVFYFFIIPIFTALIVKFNLPAYKNDKKGNNRSTKYFSKTISIIKDRKEIKSLFIITIISYLIFYGCYVTYFPVYINKVLKISAIFIGFSMSAMRITALFVSSQIDKLKEKISFKWLFIISILLYILSLISMLLIFNREFILIPSIIWGVAHGIFLPCSHIFMIMAAPVAHKGGIISSGRFFTRLGQTIGPIMMAGILYYFDLRAIFYVGIFIWSIFLVFILFKRLRFTIDN